LLLIINKKSHTGFQITLKSMISDDLKNWPYLGNGERYGPGYYKSLIISNIRLVILYENY